ncbi:MAG: hypothetical protein HC849_07660 [Oscillatoriales cyanobacterium RU_3_3]|nr:hypothetical protein [Oscillatoriales cyanobacterium RU_3_3]
MRVDKRSGDRTLELSSCAKVRQGINSLSHSKSRLKTEILHLFKKL